MARKARQLVRHKKKRQHNPWRTLLARSEDAGDRILRQVNRRDERLLTTMRYLRTRSHHVIAADAMIIGEALFLNFYMGHSTDPDD